MSSLPRRPSSATIGLVAAVVLIAAALIIPAVTAWQVNAGAFAPLHSIWGPRFGIGTVPAAVIAVLAVIYGYPLAGRLRWRTLLLVSYLVGLAWLVSLALVDGANGLGLILERKTEYLLTARSVSDVGAMLTEYVSRIPADAPDNWPVHLAGHPPGAVLFFIALVQLGLGGWLAAGIVVILIAATVPLAVLVTVRRLGDEQHARAAAPVLVLGPAAIWMAVSADAVFTAVGAWGLCCLALSATARSRRALVLWGLAAGALLGYAVMMSYGLPLLGVLAVAVLVLARNAWPLLWAAGAALAVVAVFAVFGFAWWQAYPVLVERYWAGIASRRPFEYWVWGNLAALAISAGPIAGSSVALAIGRLRRWREWMPGTRAIVLLTLAAAASILLADLSAMSKAEVERIWLPFVPWLLLAAALLPPRWQRPALAVQLGLALLVQTLLFTRW